MPPAPIPIPTAGRWPADDVTNAQAPMALRSRLFHVSGRLGRLLGRAGIRTLSLLPQR